ncbi:MAG: ATP-binding cassette domain-containing protein [Proteobacteria bacterium]|nr:ATP-binding cassette domain-containing protein [Pseudomonadota bacterium]
MISFTNVSLRRGTALLFEQSSFTIHRGNKVGLVGANGSGKSSLFRLILGQLETDLGSVDLPQELRIGHMAQEVPGSSERALDYVLAGDKQLQEVTRSLAAADEAGEYSRVAELHETLDSIDGYSAPARAEQLMAGLGFSSADSTRPLKDFSGGWRIRLNLAQTLMTPADLLLLDEPTNHLDLDAVIWLAEWLKAFDGTLLLISHDREFLDECVDHIANLQGQRIELFAGNYTAFERLRAARLAEQKSSYEKQQREVAHMQDFVRRFRAKATKARQAQSRLKALERMELIAPAHVDSPFSFEIQSSEKTSTPLLSLADACLGYETPVLSNVNLTLLPGDRIGLLGVNGAGKSTLIKSLKEELPLLSGSFTRGANLSTAYFSQHQLDELNLATSAMDHLTELGRKLGKIPSEQQIRDFLGGYNFHGDKVLDPVSRFSGGEKARLALALIAWTRPNLLLMDEPTNHLDMDMRQALTVALQTFAGAMVLVSHDRHLMMNTVDLFYLVENGEVRPFDGDLADYRNRIFKPGRGELSAAGEIKSPQPAAGPAPRKQAPGKLARQLRTRISTLDDRMARLHRKLGEVETRLTEPALYETRDHPDLQGLLRDQMELKAQLETMEEEWLALSTELESLESQPT